MAGVSNAHGQEDTHAYNPGDMHGRCGGKLPTRAVKVGFQLHRQPLGTVLRALPSKCSRGAGTHSAHKYLLRSILLCTRLFFLCTVFFFLFRCLHIFLFQGRFFEFTVSRKRRSSETGVTGRGRASKPLREEAGSWKGHFALPASHRRRWG